MKEYRRKQQPEPIGEQSFAKGMLPPMAVEAEQMVLGSIMLDPSIMPTVAGLLAPDRLYKTENQVIYSALLDMFNKSKQIDLLTIKQELQRLGKLEEIGGVIYLTSVMSNVASTANIEHHCFLINEKWIGRELARAGLDLYKHSMDSMKDPFEIMEETNQTLSRINQLVFKKQFEALPKILSENITELHRRMALKTGITGIPSSIRSLDIVTAGWQKQDLIIIAARPGMGKTAFALLCAQASAQAGYPVAVFSLEMSSQQLVFRLQSMESGVDSQKIKTGKLTDFELEKIVEASVAIENLPMHFDDTAGLSVLEFRAKVARMTHEHGIKFIVIDYIQLMKGDDGGNREQEIASISRALKGIAKEYDIPVMVLAQLSRAVESRKSKVPMLSDLRECLSVKTSNIYTNTGFQSNATSRINLLSLNKEKIKSMKSINIPKSENEVFRLKLKTGRFIDCTAKHQVLTSDGYKMLKDISTTDAVAVALNWRNEKGVYIPESKFIGWMIGNGCMYGYNVPAFITKDKVISDNFCKFIFDRFGFYPKSHPHYASKVYQWDITNSTTGNRTKEGNIVTAWLKEMDMWGRKSMDKYIPQWWMETANEQSICELIQGLWETDGSVALGKKREALSYATTSLILANQILYLTAKLGIVCHLDNGYKSAKATVNCYKITISSSDQKKCFIDKIKLDGEKGEKLGKLKLTERQSYCSNVLGRETTLRIQQDIKLHTSKRYVNSYQNRRLTKLSLKNILSSIDIVEVKNKYKWLLTDSIYWDGVESIEPLGVEPVFDRSVPVSNNFVVNGIVVHNSGAVEQDADLVIFPFRPEYYEEELMSDSITQSKGMAELHIAKHRNGSCVPVVCGFEGSRTKFYCLDTGINHQDQIEPEKFKRLVPSDMYNDDSDNTGNLKDVPF